MSNVFHAMQFAREVHKSQRRKYTNNPYVDHLAEVAGIAMSVWRPYEGVNADQFMSVCWLHDCVEDQHVNTIFLENQFGVTVTSGVQWLSDLEKGNRESRKQQSRERLARAPDWIQTIKCADLISNTSSIVSHDPKFAEIYLEEKRLLLGVLTKADLRLRNIALEMCRP